MQTITRNDAIFVKRFTRQTLVRNSATATRILLGILFLSTGVMKLAVPSLQAAFSGQLDAAGLPFHEFMMWAVPFAEIGAGILLIAGKLTRISNVFVILMMAVATYVHLVVNDPSLFPLQPEAPIIPIVAFMMSVYLLRTGRAGKS